MMKETQQIIDEISRLELSTYPYGDAKGLISQLGQFGIIQLTLHKEKSLMRARPNEAGKTFAEAKELSYKPQKLNTTYQRASTPNRTMFYAGTIPEDVKEGELDNARIVSSLEASHLLRDVNQEGEQTITFGRWIVTDDIPLVAICYHRDFAEKSSHSKELYEAYQASMKDYTPDFQKHSQIVTEFFAKEYAKTTIRGDFDYLLSATLSEIIVNKGLAGVYYPSVKAGARGFNVAISPEFADKNLKLIVAGECVIKKEGDHTLITNDTIAYLKDGEVNFKLEKIKAS
jgi:hypothetical protein